MNELAKWLDEEDIQRIYEALNNVPTEEDLGYPYGISSLFTLEGVVDQIENTVKELDLSSGSGMMIRLITMTEDPKKIGVSTIPVILK